MNPNKTKSVDDVISELRTSIMISTGDKLVHHHTCSQAATLLERAKVMSEALTEIQASCLSNRIPTLLTTKDKYNLGLGIRRWVYDRATEALQQFKGDAK